MIKNTNVMLCVVCPSECSRWSLGTVWNIKDSLIMVGKNSALAVLNDRITLLATCPLKFVIEIRDENRIRGGISVAVQRLIRDVFRGN